MRYLCVLVSLVLTTTFLQGQTWKTINPEGLSGDRRIVPKQARILQVDPESLRSSLFLAPHEAETSPEAGGMPLILPAPGRGTVEFRIVAYDLMAAEDRERFPNIRTWYGYNTDNPAQTIFLDWTERGFHASVRGGDGPSYYIDPLFRGELAYYQLYRREDLPEPAVPFHCETPGEEANDVEVGERSNLAGDCVLRQYTVAVSATVEYSNYHGAIVPADAAFVQSAVVTSLNRVNQVFTQEISLRLELIAGNDAVYFYSQADNPFSDNGVGTLLSENTDIQNDRLGPGSFDLGHVYTRAGNNGVARLRSGCDAGSAGAGATSGSAPEGDFFNIDYVAHEMGHQLGANHTQNNSCNYSSSAGMEPGSASTIMGYAGICSPNVQNRSDDYFHGRSIEEITDFIEFGSGGSCATVVNSSLNNPTVSGPADQLIPRQTPFRLTGVASGNGNLTYGWDQYDVEQGTMPPQSTNTQGPMFRSIRPTDDPVRYFPNLPDLTNGIDPQWEELPEVARDMNFRLTTRNANSTYGCAGEHEVILSVDGQQGPFRVVDPIGSTQWSAGQIAQIQWEVAGTDAPAFNSPEVDILLSLDGGQTYQTVLAGTPNDGFAEIPVPSTLSNEVRVLVQSTGNVFFNLSEQNHVIVTDAGQPTVTLSPVGATAISDCFSANDEVSFTFQTTSAGGASAPLSLSVTGLPAGASVVFVPDAPRPGGSFTATISGLSSVPAGTYPFSVNALSGEANLIADVEITKQSGGGGSGPVVFGPSGAGIDLRPTLSGQNTGADTYTIQLSEMPNFSDLLLDITTTEPEYTLSEYLVGNKTYYWRIRSANGTSGCGVSNWTEASFSTGDCLVFSSSDAPVPISTGPPTQIAEMSVNVPVNGSILDLDVYQLEVDHTYLNDLEIRLISPQGNPTLLFDRSCGANDNLLMSFDDEASTNSFNCPPTAPGIFVRPPSAPLSGYDGNSITGKWILEVRDLANLDGGSLNTFSLKACLENRSLPVSYVFFTAQAREKDILLSWETSEEEDNKGFYVERSNSINAPQWQTLGFVPAGADYQYADREALPNRDYFYRLRQTDLDGTVHYSDIRRARLGGGATDFLAVFPNPGDGMYSYQHGLGEALPYSLFDGRGQLLESGELAPESGTLHLRSRPNGVYYLRVRHASFEKSIRLLKL
ncbi:reprolysin-like metallopeptidase [Lewinella sp. W8]|uniref:reprolysin-like metallopeptidase n=1 Tax=Lewinella sp. W8 TaxID=2528208 RepID=UPI001068C10E|nr:zinc-dependent metalloprotease family protein [Lewinella sp. W8]MTB51846.1 T9SS type A sorting domain-containing protein [Lewinella sp. W8]